MRFEPIRGTLWATGIVVGADLILTCAEAAQPGDSLELRLANGQRIGARFLAQDAALGVTLLRADHAEGLEPIPPADSEPYRIGDWLLVLGFDAVQSGEQSGLRLRLGTLAEPPHGPNGRSAHLMLRLSECWGTCGAVVVDGQGVFAGMVVDVRVDRDSSRRDGAGGERIESHEDRGGLRTLTPTTIAAVRDRLLERSRRPEGYLGVHTEASEELMLAGGSGSGALGALRVLRVLPGSPAEAAGILPEDHILEVDGRPVPEVALITERIAASPPGTEIRVKVLRNGVPVVLRPVLGDRSALEWLEREAALDQLRQKRLRRSIQQLQVRLRQLEERQGVQR